MGTPLQVTREQVLAFRRGVDALGTRLPPPGAASLRRAAWAGLQDSVPRAALLSIHARLHDVSPSDWSHPSLVQVWGPRYSTYVVAEQDRAVFTLGRLSLDPERRRAAEDLADRLERLLDGARWSNRDAGQALGIHPSGLRYAGPTGRVLLRWEGGGRPVVWTVPAPEVEPHQARPELARRFLHVLGPGTPGSFEQWAGLRSGRGAAVFAELGDALVPVRTPAGEGWVLAADEESLRSAAGEAAPARLLPSSDTHVLAWGRDRELLVPDRGRRDLLWTPRVWPGAVLVDGEVAGTWRRARQTVTVQPWGPLAPAAREAVEAEAASMPLPDLGRPVTVRWEG